MPNIIHKAVVRLDERVYSTAMRQLGWRYTLACKASHAVWKLRALVEARMWPRK